MARDPEHPVGTPVRVLPNGGRNRTLHVGVVRTTVWHDKHGCWNYYLQVGGRKISKRYVFEDLERAEDRSPS